MIQPNRLIINQYSDQADLSRIHLLMNPIVHKSYVIPDFNSFDEASRFFHKLMAYSHSSEHYEYGIYYQKQLIGFINDVDIEEDSIEIGYVIHPNYHNMGFATEMLKAVIDDLFHKGYKTIYTCAFDFNTPSFRVMEKCGMKRINRKMTMMHQDKLQTCLYYAINADEGGQDHHE
jgi:RimJ/RimL family protein N-acetyltransferase